jgi:hypothetical protein
VTNLYHQEIIDALEEGATPRLNFARIEQRLHSLPKGVFSAKRAIITAAFLVGAPCLAAAAVLVPSPALQHAIVQQLARLNIIVPFGAAFQMGTVVSVQELKNAATFDVVLPSGLPATATLLSVTRNGADNNSYTLDYQLPQGRKAWVTLQKKAPNIAYVPLFIVSQSDDSGGNLKMKRYPAQVWSAGDEVVTLASDSLSEEQINTVKRAMNGVDVPLHHGPIR